MTPKALVPLCALALSSLGFAQIPVPGPIPECGGVEIEGLSSRPQPWQSRSAAIQDQGLCSEYAFGGWITTMYLYAGEGFLEHRDKIERSVKTWNEALEGFNQRPVVEIIRHPAENPFLPDDFWSKRIDYAKDLSGDGQSVIYFKGDDVEGSPAGFVYPRTDSNGNMVEADIYINIADWEEYGPYLFLAQEILDLDGRIIYVPVDSVYKTMLHELGHALGLLHVPVSGNIMSYNYMPYMKDLWQPLVGVDLFRQLWGATSRAELEGILFEDNAFTSGMFSSFIWHGDELAKYQSRDDPDILEILMLEYFTATAGLGEQDRMSLLCAYDFSDWNH